MNFILPLLVILTSLLILSLSCKYRHLSVCILQMLLPDNSAFRKVTESTAIGKLPAEGVGHSTQLPIRTPAEGTLPAPSWGSSSVLGWQCQKMQIYRLLNPPSETNGSDLTTVSKGSACPAKTACLFVLPPKQAFNQNKKELLLQPVKQIQVKETCRIETDRQDACFLPLPIPCCDTNQTVFNTILNPVLASSATKSLTCWTHRHLTWDECPQGAPGSA